MFTDLPILKPLCTHFLTYTKKRIHDVQREIKSSHITPLETYAVEVLTRVGELDNCIDSMRLAMYYMLDLVNTPKVESNYYRYHYENFILRLAGLVDRSYCLVGAAIKMEATTFEKIGGRKAVENKLRHEHAIILANLKHIEEMANRTTAIRNDIAHNRAFSCRELGLITALQSQELIDKEVLNENAFIAGFYSINSSELALIISELVAAIEQLIASTVPVFDGVCRDYQVRNNEGVSNESQ